MQKIIRMFYSAASLIALACLTSATFAQTPMFSRTFSQMTHEGNDVRVTLRWNVTADPQLELLNFQVNSNVNFRLAQGFGITTKRFSTTLGANATGTEFTVPIPDSAFIAEHLSTVEARFINRVTKQITVRFASPINETTGELMPESGFIGDPAVLRVEKVLALSRVPQFSSLCTPGQDCFEITTTGSLGNTMLHIEVLYEDGQHFSARKIMSNANRVTRFSVDMEELRPIEHVTIKAVGTESRNQREFVRLSNSISLGIG